MTYHKGTDSSINLKPWFKMLLSTGAVYAADTREHVYRILKAATVDTFGWEWIKRYDDDRENGRLAFPTLREH